MPNKINPGNHINRVISLVIVTMPTILSSTSTKRKLFETNKSKKDVFGKSCYRVFCCRNASNSVEKDRKLVYQKGGG